MSQFPEYTSNLSTANWRASVLTYLQGMVSGSAPAKEVIQGTSPTSTIVPIQTDAQGVLYANVRSQTVTVQVTPTITVGTYTAGNCLGGLLTFNNAVGSLGSGIIQDVSIISKSSVQTTALNLYLFNASPTSTFTDRTAVTWAPTDYTKLIGLIPLSTTNTISGATMTLWYADAIAKAISLGAGVTTLYGALVVQSTTAAAFQDIAVNLTVLKDG